MEEKKNYYKIAMKRLINRISWFWDVVYSVTNDDMADKETRAFWRGVRYAADACMRPCNDAINWAESAEAPDNSEEVEDND